MDTPKDPLEALFDHPNGPQYSTVEPVRVGHPDDLLITRRFNRVAGFLWAPLILMDWSTFSLRMQLALLYKRQSFLINQTYALVPSASVSQLSFTRVSQLCSYTGSKVIQQGHPSPNMAMDKSAAILTASSPRRSSPRLARLP